MYRKERARYQNLLSVYLRVLPPLFSASIAGFINDLLIWFIYDDVCLPGIVIYIPLTIIVVTAIYIVYYLFNKYNYKPLFNKFLTIEMYELSSAKLFMKSIDTDYKPRNSKIETDKKGFDYLYFLFNKRYSKSLIVKTLFFGFSLGGFFWIIYLCYKEEPDPFITRLLLSFNLFSFYISMSTEYLKLCYTQLDSKLLIYNFYKKNILEHMKQRFKGFIIYDLI